MKKGVTITLIVVIFVITVALAVVVTILVLRPTTESEPQLAPIAPEGPELEPMLPTIEVPDDWQEFASVEYEVEFSYPPEWGSLESDLITGAGDSLFDFPEAALTFGDGVPIFRSMRIVRIDDVLSSGAYGTEALQDLQEVYSRRDVDGMRAEDFTFPPVNAGLYSYTDPVYVQNPGGSFRGFYAYTIRVQSDPGFGDSIELSELTLQLTDGDVAVQVLISVDTFNEMVNFTAASSCNQVDSVIAPGTVHTSCAIPRELEFDRQNLETLVASVEHLRSL